MLKTVLILLFFLVISSNISGQDNIDFSFETINNDEYRFSQLLENGPTLVSFWALWCKPCRAEMRHLESIYENYKDKGLTILGVNQDTPRSLAKVKSYISTHNITFPIALDPNTDIFQQFNGQSIPLSILYNKEGKVVYKHVGYLPGDEIELENRIKTLLGIEN